MTQSPTQAIPLTEPNKQPDTKAPGAPLTDAEKAAKAQADKAQLPGSSNTKS